MPNKNQSIAVVDDDSSMRQAIERLLNAAGFRTFTYPSAEMFLLATENKDTGCLILDIELPGLSGFELQERLAQNKVVRPFIFISGYDEPGSQARAEAAGAIAFIKKPFQGQCLIAAVRRALGDVSAGHETTLLGN